MYYQNYDDYMRDVFYFNQMPNQNMVYPNMGYNMVNQNFQANNMNNMNPNFNNMNPNYNNMYPGIYRIVQPVVSRVVTGNNYQYLNEDNLNSMVDTVYNIVEGDNMNSEGENNNTVTTTTTTTTQRNNNSNQNNSQNSGNSTVQTSASSRNSNNNNQNSSNLLRDLIKILILKEIINRNNLRRFSNNSMFGYQNIPNYYEQRYMF